MPQQDVPLVILVGISGAGKTTVQKAVIESILLQGKIAFSVSATTRSMRSNEEHGREYFFMSVAEFQAAVADGLFIEWKKIHGNLYGTLRSEIVRILDLGRVPVLDLDIQGAIELQEQYGDRAILIKIGLKREAAEKRLQRRNTPAEEIAIRMETAEREEMEMQKLTFNLEVDNSGDTAVSAIAEVESFVFGIVRKVRTESM